MQLCLKQRYTYCDPEALDCYRRIREIPTEELTEKSVYHSECYKKVTHRNSLERLLKRHNEFIVSNPNAEFLEDIDETEDLNQESEVTPAEEKSLRSKTQGYNKELCIICQTEGGKLRKVEFSETGRNMLQVSKSLANQDFFIRMNSIPNPDDAVANDVKYHLKCWVTAQRSAVKVTTAQEEIQELDDLGRVIADVEIIGIVNLNLKEDGVAMDMNNINKTYNNLIGNDDQTEENYKRYLKKLLKDNVPGLVFSRPPCRRKSEQLCTSSYQAKAIDTFKNNPDDYTTIFEAAKIIRKEVLQQRIWKFDGNYTGFDCPTALSSLLRWVILGPKTNIDSSCVKKKSIDNRVDNISQIIVKATKSRKQITHSTQPESDFRDVTETPFAVGLGLHVHKETRNKKLLDCLADLGLSISYDSVMKIENGLGNAVIENMSINQGVFVPPNVEIGKPLHFAIDNIDFRNDTAEGKSEFHGTTHVAFQNNSNAKVNMLKLQRTKAFTFEHSPVPLVHSCAKPNPPNETFEDFESPRSLVDLSSFSTADRVWGFFHVIDKKCKLPTWSAFNSLLTDMPTSTVTQGLPLHPGSPTDWSNLFTALKLVQGINVAVTGNSKTIVTLDLQLYSKCMQLREANEIKENFIFRLGELHIVFAFLKVIGKYINGSGLDQTLIEAGIYGPTTLGQILEGKHMKRGMEAFMTLYLSLYKLYLDSSLDPYPEIRDTMKKHAQELPSNMDKESAQENFKQMLLHFRANTILEKFKTFDESLDQQGLFLRNFMLMYETLLQFVRSSREEHWELHLSSLDAMIPYFFAHDQLNYARLSPLYLATMIELKKTDIHSWQYLKENFSINKSGIPFCSIGSDHALEQENKIMKVTGGVTGLTQKPTSLNRFCLIAPALNALSKAFCEKNNIGSQYRKQHYQLTGSTNERISSNANKVIDVFDTFGVDFKENQAVFNLVSKAILPEEVADELLRHGKVGEELYCSFVTERLKGNISVWSPMKKRNLKTFRNQAKVTKSKIGDKVIQLKEERTLLSRFLLCARKRPELDLEESIGSYEFSVVPKSMFTQDGQPLLTSDKAKVLHEVENLSKGLEIEPQEEETLGNTSAIIIDGMALVNKVNKDNSVKTWKVIQLTMYVLFT